MYDIKKYMKQQPVINIGMIGHVANGKSSIVKKLTGKATQAFSSEKERNITIRLGYANAKFINVIRVLLLYVMIQHHLMCQNGLNGLNVLTINLILMIVRVLDRVVSFVLFFYQLLFYKKFSWVFLFLLLIFVPFFP